MLAGLGYAHLFQPAYAECARGKEHIVVRAIMDDLAICGPPTEAFAAYASFVQLAATRGVTVNQSKTHAQQPAGSPSDDTVRLARENDLCIHLGNHEYVGGYVGVDDAAGTCFVATKLAKQCPLTRAITDPAFPVHLALHVAKVHVLPKPMFLLRSLPLRVTSGPLADFDSMLRSALSLRLDLPSPIPPSALISFVQPVGNGGIGMRALEQIGPAAKWAAAAAVAQDVLPFAAFAPAAPFVRDREAAYASLCAAGVDVADSSYPTYTDIPVSEEEKLRWGPFADPRLLHLPPSADAIRTFYGGERRLPALQRMLSLSLESIALQSFLDSAGCTAGDRIRLTSCRSLHSRRWLHPQGSLLPDKQFAMAVRLRLGLPPLTAALPSPCPLCSRDITDDAWHPFACASIRRRATTTRHDRAMHLVAEFARSCGVLARFEPKDAGSLVPDGELIFSLDAVVVDLSGIHSLAPSHLRDSSAPGLAMERRAARKHTKYDAHAATIGCRFKALVVDAFGSLQKEFCDLLAEIEAHAQDSGWTSPTRLTLDSFLARFAVEWQASNAAIVTQYTSMCTLRRLRTVPKRLRSCWCGASGWSCADADCRPPPAPLSLSAAAAAPPSSSTLNVVADCPSSA